MYNSDTCFCASCSVILSRLLLHVPCADVNIGLCSILWQSVPQLSYTLHERLCPFVFSEPGSYKHALVHFSWCTGEKVKNPALSKLSSHSQFYNLYHTSFQLSFFLPQAEEIILFSSHDKLLCALKHPVVLP